MTLQPKTTIEGREPLIQVILPCRSSERAENAQPTAGHKNSNSHISITKKSNYKFNCIFYVLRWGFHVVHNISNFYLSGPQAPKELETATLMRQCVEHCPNSACDLFIYTTCGIPRRMQPIIHLKWLLLFLLPVWGFRYEEFQAVCNTRQVDWVLGLTVCKLHKLPFLTLWMTCRLLILFYSLLQLLERGSWPGWTKTGRGVPVWLAPLQRRGLVNSLMLPFVITNRKILKIPCVTGRPELNALRV